MTASDRSTGRAVVSSESSQVGAHESTDWGAEGLKSQTPLRSSVSRLGRRGLAALEREMTERDVAVVRSVGDFRFLTAVQIERLHFTDAGPSPTTARAARRALERLTDQRVLDRLQRRIGGVRAGSAAFIYCVGPVGRRLLLAERPPSRGREPSATFLRHSLAIAEVFVAATAATRAGGLSLIGYQPEPRCWRTMPGMGVGDQLRPDLYLVVAGEDTEWHWFIEADLGTEHAPTLRRKCRQYQAYYQSGVEQARHGVFPRVAWLATTAERAGQISRVISADKNLRSGLFVVATISDTGNILVQKGQR